MQDQLNTIAAALAGSGSPAREIGPWLFVYLMGVSVGATLQGGERFGPVFAARGLLGASVAMQERWAEAVQIYPERAEGIARADAELSQHLR